MYVGIGRIVIKRASETRTDFVGPLYVVDIIKFLPYYIFPGYYTIVYCFKFVNIFWIL